MHIYFLIFDILINMLAYAERWDVCWFDCRHIYSAAMVTTCWWSQNLVGDSFKWVKLKLCRAGLTVLFSAPSSSLLLLSPPPPLKSVFEGNLGSGYLKERRAAGLVFCENTASLYRTLFVSVLAVFCIPETFGETKCDYFCFWFKHRASVFAWWAWIRTSARAGVSWSHHLFWMLFVWLIKSWGEEHRTVTGALFSWGFIF